MNRRRRKLGGSPVLLTQVRSEVISQTIIERKFSRHLPRVLRVEAELFLSQSRMCGIADADGFYVTQKETGIAEADIHPVRRVDLLKWLACRVGGEAVAAGGPIALVRRIALGSEFRSELVTVVVFHPGHAGIKTGTLSDRVRVGGATDIPHAARSISSRKSR